MSASPHRRSLIVGAHGQVGAAIAGMLGPGALATGRTPAADGVPAIDLAALAARPALAAELLDPLAISAVYCAGGATDVERCEREPGWAMAANCDGPAALAAAARHRPFVFFSTDYVFDGTAGPYDEEATPNPLSVYGRSKLLGEAAVRAAHPAALIVRTNVVYGPDPRGKNFVFTLRRLLSAGTPMRVPVDQINNPTYNRDLAHAAVALVDAGQSGVFNIAGPLQLSRYDFAVVAAQSLGLDAALIQPVTTAELNQVAARPLQSGLIVHKLLSTLDGFKLRTPAEGVRDFANGLEPGNAAPPAG